MSRDSKATKYEIQRNRLAAYQIGWDDGYAEGYGKAFADLIASFPAHTAYGRGVRSAIHSRALAIRAASAAPKKEQSDE